jgi:hypothetical protein
VGVFGVRENENTCAKSKIAWDTGHSCRTKLGTHMHNTPPAWWRGMLLAYIDEIGVRGCGCGLRVAGWGGTSGAVRVGQQKDRAEFRAHAVWQSHKSMGVGCATGRWQKGTVSERVGYMREHACAQSAGAVVKRGCRRSHALGSRDTGKARPKQDPLTQPLAFP